MTGSAVRDHGEYEVDEEDAVIQPERYEDNEPGPANTFVQSQDEQDEEHETDEPGEEGPVQHRHPQDQSCLLQLTLHNTGLPEQTSEGDSDQRWSRFARRAVLAPALGAIFSLCHF